MIFIISAIIIYLLNVRSSKGFMFFKIFFDRGFLKTCDIILTTEILILFSLI
jgi:hypothetical protein